MKELCLKHVDEDNSAFTDDSRDSGPLNYVPSLAIIVEEDGMVEEYPKHVMPGEFHAFYIHNLLDVTTGDFKQFVASHALKQI